MGNQQTLTYGYSFTENDSDSGYGEMQLSSSPFEMNKETSFNYLYETNNNNNTNKQTTDKSSPNKSRYNTDNNAQKNLGHVDETVSAAKRQNSLLKSKSIGINIKHNKSINHTNDSIDLDDDPFEDNDYPSPYSTSLHSTSSIISVSLTMSTFYLLK